MRFIRRAIHGPRERLPLSGGSVAGATPPSAVSVSW
jgi:hypothetical protein